MDNIKVLGDFRIIIKPKHNFKILQVSYMLQKRKISRQPIRISTKLLKVMIPLTVPKLSSH